MIVYADVVHHDMLAAAGRKAGQAVWRQIRWETQVLSKGEEGKEHGPVA